MECADELPHHPRDTQMSTIDVTIGDLTAIVNQDDLVPWIAGYQGKHKINLSIVAMCDDGDSDGEVISVKATSTETTNLRTYRVRSDDTDWSLPERWVLPWCAGRALANGVDLASLLSVGRYSHHDRRVRALMVADHHGWIEYLGYDMEGKSDGVNRPGR